MKLEDLDVWKEARKLTNMIYKIVAAYPKIEDYNLSKHMRECPRSVAANVAEGFGRFNFQESMQFYRISRGSLFELRNDIYLSFDLGYIDEEKMKELIGQVDKVGMLLNGFINSTKKLKNNDK